MLSGCTAAAVATVAGTAGIGLAQGQAEAFINGELKAARMVSLDEVEVATLQAMKELKVEVITHRRGPIDAYIMAKSKGGPEIKVSLKEKTPVVTKIETRVGIMGDQAVSRLVMTRIDAMLGIAHPLIPIEVSPIVAPPHPPVIEGPKSESRPPPPE